MFLLVELNTSKIIVFHMSYKWNKLDPKIRSFRSYNMFSDAMLELKDLLKGKSPTLITHLEPIWNKNVNILDYFQMT